MRVPLLTGSLPPIVFLADRETSVEEINNALQDAARDGRWSVVLTTATDPLVSSDIVGDPHGAVVDLSLTKVIDGDLCAVYSWYDNEFGFTNTLLAHLVERAAYDRFPRKRELKQERIMTSVLASDANRAWKRRKGTVRTQSGNWCQSLIAKTVAM